MPSKWGKRCLVRVWRHSDTTVNVAEEFEDVGNVLVCRMRSRRISGHQSRTESQSIRKQPSSRNPPSMGKVRRRWTQHDRQWNPPPPQLQM
jgi:hypothetical protein